MSQPSNPITNRYRLLTMLIILLAAGASLFFFWQSRQPQPPATSQNIPLNPSTVNIMNSQPNRQTGDPERQPLLVRLSQGQAQPQTVSRVPLVQGESLPLERIEQILSRLPELPIGPEDELKFRLSTELIPPPRPGATVNQPFPPPDETTPAPETVYTGPLEVLRFSPEGEIPIAPFLSVTFNQPMVPLATLDQLSAADVPVQIDPPLPGTWRWLGTRTLTFQADVSGIDRFPKATTYQARIPAGTQSASGNALAQEVAWTFTTPAPVIASSFPVDVPRALDTLIYIEFDQRIDPAAMLGSIRLSAGSSTPSLRLATQAEVDADADIRRMAEQANEGRWMVFRAASPLPADTLITVTVRAGAPSAEGPLTTPTDQSFTFRTYAPLRVIDHGCAWYDTPCPPLTPFFINFNNPLDTSAYRPEMIQISPEIPGAFIDVYGERIEIRGATSANTTYTITLSPDLQDIFGQRLGSQVRLTIRTGQAEPVLYRPENVLVTLDPAAETPVYSVFSLNYATLNMRIYRVQPGDWNAFQEHLQNFSRTDQARSVPGTQVFSGSISIENSGALTETPIDLSPYLSDRLGHLIVIVEPPDAPNNDRYWQTVQVWVQGTRIGLDAFSDYTQIHAWTTDLQTGAPLSGVSVQAAPSQSTFTTAADGLARFPGLDSAPATSHITASLGDDSAILPRSSYWWWQEGWYMGSQQDSLRWYVVDDRQIYRPGEELHLKGWIRRFENNPTGDISLLGSGLTSLSYRIIGPQGNELGSGTAQVNALGGFDLAFQIPTVTNLGYAQIELLPQGGIAGVDNNTYYHSFQILEFRRPEFEVTARNETTGPYFAGESATLAVEARYYAGDPLQNAEVTWNVQYSAGQYSPPNWPDFTFGKWTPWWRIADRFMGYPGFPGGETRWETFTSATDATGTHYLRLEFTGEADGEPVSILAEGTVMDVNRQAWTGTTSLLVHPSTLYVGLRSDRYFVERGTPLDIDIIVTGVDGNPVPNRTVEVTAARLEWTTQNGEWTEVEVDTQTCTQVSGTEPVTCTFQTPIGGSYRITARVTDDQGRQNLSQFNRWVSGGERPPSRSIEQEEATLIPNQENYRPGDVAEILVQAPFYPAEGLVTLSRSGILSTETFRMEEGSYTLRIPILDAHTPNLHVQVDLVGQAPRTDDQGDPIAGLPPRPAFASGTLNLPIPPLHRTLTLSLDPEQRELEPGGETTLNLRVTDASGRPVADAEFAVIIVDEAVLALSAYQLPDPLEIFYAQRPSDLTSLYGRASIILANPLTLSNGQVVEKELAMEESISRGAAPVGSDSALPPMEAPSAAQPGEGQTQAEPDPIRLRSDFNPLAVFSPSVRSAADGTASVQVRVPDNLTRYRIMVVAVDNSGRQFGKAESSLTARLPLMVRPSAPRFLNFGDRFELPVVLQNQTDDPMEVEVVLNAFNLDPATAGQRVVIPARDRVEVRFPTTTLLAGNAVLQIAAVSGTYADAATITLPVYTPATTEAFATYGVLDDGVVYQPLQKPTGVFPQYGGLEITTSSTALQALTDAVLYLTTYPYEGTEPIASRILSIAALRDVLSAFNAEGLPSPDEMVARVNQDIQDLQGFQNADGGFPYWRRGMDSIPFNSIHVAHALARAEQMGFEVPPAMKSSLLAYLRDIESRYLPEYSEDTRQRLSAYALNVRWQWGASDPLKARRLLEEVSGANGLLDQAPLEVVGWLWPVLGDAPGMEAQLDQIRRHVTNRAVETAGAANFVTGFNEQSYLTLSSDRRTDAILLEALILDNPDHDLIPKVVNGLLAHQVKGRWNNTQENVFVLLAMDRYFDTYEAQTPDFVARIWLGEGFAGEHIFQGRTTDRLETEIPMQYLVREMPAGSDIIISKDGPGRLYYRLGLRYAPGDLNLPALDMGFVVQRIYEAVDDPGDVRLGEDGVWYIKAGARVRVRLTMVADSRRYHVALVDPLPAGLEILNPELAITGSTPPDPDSAGPSYHWWWWWWNWYEHENLRDERAEAFTPLLWDGVHEYTYIARATTPGTFVVPPAKAEEMYSPEVFGRSAGDIVVVE
jgi:alpha-2-macroglobulin